VSGSAQVHSIDAISAFGSALRIFEDQASRALIAIDEQANGALQWLEHDAPAYWKEQVRRCYDDVARTRTALETCRMRTVADHRPSCIEETEAHRAAQRKLREAEEKIDVVRRWAQKVREEIDEYRGRMMRFQQCLDGDVPQFLALLKRTVATLDAYADRPQAARGGSPASSTAPPQSSSSPETP
jgi:hypothetical protein